MGREMEAGPGRKMEQGGSAVRGLTIREMTTQAEYAACIALQYATWGSTYREAVPASVLKVTQKVGGIAAGAFNASGQMVGFVYGVTGYERGQGVHWSHMLAVAPGERDRGVGRSLKRYQQERLRAAGVSRVRWSFDPLFARNAHLNVNVLGARLIDYVVDMYPDTGSDLHAFGTDRFVAEWRLDSDRSNGPVAEGEGEEAPAGADGDWDCGRDEAGRRRRGHDRAGAEERVEIPADAESMRETSLTLLREWRLATRSSLTDLLKRGYEVTGFARVDGHSAYILTQPRA